MKINITEINVQNNEELTSNLILRYLKEKRIIYLKKEQNLCEKNIKQINLPPPAIILKSSGSMNKPKICVHTIENIEKSAKYLGIWLQDQGLELENCFIFNTLPLNHISGFMPLWRSQQWQCGYIYISPALLKNTEYLFQKTISIDKIEKRNLVTSLVPTQLKRLLKEENGIKWLKLFDIVWIGGSSIPDHIATQCRKEKINLAPCYGTTETAAMITCLKPKDFLKGNNTVGEALKDVNLKITQKGLITINAKRLGAQFINSTTLKDFANKNGWWESCDLGEIIKIDEHYFLNFIGRADNAFQSGGETIFPDLIKRRLAEIIMEEELPIENIIISKIKDEMWENRLEVSLSFNNQTDLKFIPKYLKKLEQYYLNWPSYERPKKMIVLDNKLNYSHINYEIRSWKDN